MPNLNDPYYPDCLTCGGEGCKECEFTGDAEPAESREFDFISMEDGYGN
jgi:hypothetical protein